MTDDGSSQPPAHRFSFAASYPSSRPASPRRQFFTTEPTRLRRQDRLFITACVLIAAASLAVALRYFHVAFPEASIDFRVSRPESMSIAQNFLWQHGLSLADPVSGRRGSYQHAARFNYDDETKTFLERELGLPATQRLVNSRVHLWRWEHRWFRPLYKEEFRVAVSPAGDVVGFNHEIDEAAAGARLSERDARARAEAFLRQTMKVTLDQLDFVSAEQQQKPNRIDYIFIWKDRAPLAAAGAPPVVEDATYRRLIRFQGDAVGQYREYLQVPDQWQRDYQTLRSRNNATAIVDEVLFFSVLGLALLGALVTRLRRGDIRWRVAIKIGVAGGLLKFLAVLNALPLGLFGFDTTQSYGAFAARRIFGALFAGIGLGVFLTLLAAGAEPLYRERFPSKLSLRSFLTWRGLRTKAFFLSVILGITLAFFFFAYQTVFYLLANRLGAWTPSDIPYDEILSTRFPWLFVLLGGFFPAISEEFTFRMFAIPLFERWFKYLWSAVIAAAFLWGFGHAAYPNQPFYIRGVEVGVGGVLLSWIMIRFNILTTVVWHYTVDAIYTALLLLRSHNVYLRTSGALTAFIAAIPLLFAVVAYLRTGRFADIEGASNAEESRASLAVEAPETAPAELPAYRRLDRRQWALPTVAAIILCGGFLLPSVRWDSASFSVTAAQASEVARRFVAAQGFDPRPYREATVSGPSVDSTAAHFVFTAGGQSALVKEYSGPLAPARWLVRLYIPLQKQEFDVGISPDGRRITGYQLVLDENAPGAFLETRQAQARAEEFLRARGIDPQTLVLKTAQTERRKARADSNFVWEAGSGSPLNVGDAHFRVSVGTVGDRVGSYRPFLYVPEEKVRAYEKISTASVLLTGIRVLLFSSLAGILVWAFVRAARRSAVRWLRVLVLAAVAGILAGIAVLLQLPAAYQNYPTEYPPSLYVISIAGSAIVAAVVVSATAMLLLGGLACHHPEAFASLTRRGRGLWGRDATIASLLAIAWLGGWTQWRTFLMNHFTSIGWPALPIVPSLETTPPGALSLIAAILLGCASALGLGIILPVIREEWRRSKTWVWAGLVLLWLSTLPASHSGGQFALALAVSSAACLVFAGLIWYVLRNNPLAYLSSAACVILVGSGVEFTLQHARVYRVAGGVLVGVAAAWLLWIGFSGTAGQPLEPALVGSARGAPSLRGSAEAAGDLN